MSKDNNFTQHDSLRKTYSEILKTNLYSDKTLRKLDNESIEILFQELTKWFGTSPPSTKGVKEDLNKIIEKRLNLHSIELGDD
ncbi:hypothetical protein N9M86_03760 [Euryarchaeota archaeon]|nr:hypothetical protein [Euryarchaeota archaeon]